MNLNELKQKALSLPLSPGVYLMKDSQAEIIYVGKAKKLKNRVKSYFCANSTHDAKVLKMVSNISDFDYILTDSEYEALVLECSLIKQHQPKYNILLKDDKGFYYIKITNDAYKSIKIVNNRLNDGAKYIGPYVNSHNLSETLRQMKKIFKLPDCNLKFNGKKIKDRPCLNYYIQQCSAVCQGWVSAKEHNETVNLVLNFVRSAKKCVTDDLTKQMQEAAKNLQYEKAAELRDRIKSIEKIQSKQKVILSKTREQDVISFMKSSKYLCFVVFRFSEGKLYHKEEFLLQNIFFDEFSIYSDFIKRYYSEQSNIPSQIIIEKSLEDKNLLERWLSEKSNKKVNIIIPEHGQQLEILKMCKNNAREVLFQEELRLNGNSQKILSDLARFLNLDKIPQHIEAYDVSNISGKQNVGSMVVFENAIPNKEYYRKFQLKNVSKQDDYASMVEMLDRRIKEYYNKSDRAFAILPHLILIDGGKGHVNAIRNLFSSYKISLPIYGMVKDKKHRTSDIVSSKEFMNLKSNPDLFKFITRIQDEVHRFTIKYHKNLREKDLLKISLTDIKNIGPVKSKNLFKYFKTLQAISEATPEELEKVYSISAQDAVNVYNYFNDKQHIL